MTLRKFNADFTSASQKIAGGAVPGVTSITKGDSDGEIVVHYKHESLPGQIRIQALSQNVDEYPDGNMFMLFTDDEEASRPVVDLMKTVQDYLFGMRLYEMVSELSSHFQAALDASLAGDGGGAPSPVGPQDEAEDADEEANDEYDEIDEDDEVEDDDYLDDEAFGLSSFKPTIREATSIGPSSDRALIRQRLRRDLRQAKLAGYKVGLLDDLRHSGTRGIVSISIRAQKLGLSEEAMEAWDVDGEDYIVLLIRFQKYTPAESIIELPSSFTHVRFRVGKCAEYKPSFSEALGAFSNVKSPDGEDEVPTKTEPPNKGPKFRKLFISNSLEQYMDECFVSLLKLRSANASSWDEANDSLISKAAFNMGDYEGVSSAQARVLGDDQACVLSDDDTMDIDPPSENHRTLASDHMAQQAPEHGRSLPLIAMEFAMHYFVKCTEYCLRCHQKLDKGFEALRPYVCSKPLCLFQYMAMGFGPSIEHEILTEPYVVDLLVSLCYAAVHLAPTPYRQLNTAPGQNNMVTSLPIRELPVGLHLQVPNLHDPDQVPLRAHASCGETRLVLDVEPSQTMDDRPSPGKWIAFRAPNKTLTRHAVICDLDPSTKSFTVKLMGESGGSWSPSMYGFPQEPHDPAASLDPDLVDVFFYDTDLDSMTDVVQKGAAIRHILDTLPPIPEIAAFLRSRVHSSLRSMERISRTAASLLQWIVSSNRSCIFQVDARPHSEDETTTSLLESSPHKNREHERILGMDGWMQFRFAQGSPDKELRFRRALQEVAARKRIETNPTIFAWHGSSLPNWHSIVRSGLDYNVITNGRAFGNGVYFSPHLRTSMGYSNGAALIWGNSTLKFSTCLSLNEIVNAPDEFVSKSPHYVVSQNDWHQCRYLFVQSYRQEPYRAYAQGAQGVKHQEGQQKEGQQKEGPPENFHTQATNLGIFGDNGQLKIPLAAIPFRHVGAGLDTQSAGTKRMMVRREEEESAEEDPEDVEFLFSHGESDGPSSPPRKKISPSILGEDKNMLPGNRPLTPDNTDQIVSDFVPGSLDITTLTKLEPPSFANDYATKALAREMKKLQEVQAKTPFHELGWYIDFEKISNLFQWIVEFHSFDASLPLAQDMKKLGVTSIVFEIRFGKDYPISPPFVRVIRPRFLPFMEGGGGHVTGGGAMCMELLTNSGWSPVNSMESVLLQVRMALCNLEPKPARLNNAFKNVLRAPGGNVPVSSGYYNGDYGVGEAVEAYIRAARTHGWKVPEDLSQTAHGT